MTVRDEFFWLGEINKATLVINSRQGLLPMPIAEEAAKALREVLADGDADPTKRAKTYITFEPLMLKKADPVITLMHAGRSSQDMHATYRSAILRDHVLEVGDALNAVLETMTDLADKNRETVVPNYTNGVAAQPNSLAHYFLAFLAGFSRDAQKLRRHTDRSERSARRVRFNSHRHLSAYQCVLGRPDGSVRSGSSLDSSAGRRRQHLRFFRNAAETQSRLSE